jgi:hypothetical protein
VPAKPTDIPQLEAFRRAARQVREASIIVEKRDVRVKVLHDRPGWVSVYLGLLSAEPFRSLAMAIRLVYQETEDAHFFKICNIVYRLGDEAAQAQVATLRLRWKAVFTDGSGDVAIDEPGGTIVVIGADVFDHWLYGVAFHQDAWRQPAVNQLATAGVRFHWSVQSSALTLAGIILDLDVVVGATLTRATSVDQSLRPPTGT